MITRTNGNQPWFDVGGGSDDGVTPMRDTLQCAAYRIKQQLIANVDAWQLLTRTQQTAMLFDTMALRFTRSTDDELYAAVNAALDQSA